MKISLRLFAAARDSIGEAKIGVDLQDGATIATLRTALQTEYPELNSLFALAMFAINEDYANNDTPLSNDDVIACIPPVSGG
jgi:molybdopterin synthase sulfur carrier subunit